MRSDVITCTMQQDFSRSFDGDGAVSVPKGG